MQIMFRVLAVLVVISALMVFSVFNTWQPSSWLIQGSCLLLAVFMGVVAVTGRGLSKSASISKAGVENAHGLEQLEEDKTVKP
jgi:hypothetical protein